MGDLPENPIERLRMQGKLLLQEGRLAEAEPLFETLCHDNPRDAELHYRLGSIRGRLGKHEQAVDCFRRAISLQPNAMVAYCGLGESLRQLGHYPESEACFRRAHQLAPDSPDALLGLARALLNQQQVEEAMQCLHRIVELKPDSADALSTLGEIYEGRRQTDLATSYYRRALTIDPDHAGVNNRLGYALYRQGRLDEAIMHQKRAINARPDLVSPRVDLGHLYLDTGNLQAAKTAFRHALQLDPEHLGAVTGMAAAYEREGDIRAAWDMIRPFVENGVENYLLANAYARICRNFSCCDDATDLLKRSLEKSRGNPVIQEQLRYNLGRLLDARGKYDEAFENFRLANSSRPDTFSQPVQAGITSAIIEVFDWQHFRTAPRATIRSSRPLFIVGMPRSGTSLVEQILASHPDVYGAGELPDIGNLVAGLPGLLGARPGYPHNMRKLTAGLLDTVAGLYLDHLEELAPGAARVTDKMPQNFLHLGLIARAFPECRVIHCTRDPRDTCLSIYFQNFADSHDYANRLENLGFYYRQYERLMQHWKGLLDIPILDVRYEDLVNDQEKHSRDLVEFAGLEWDDRVLAFHSSRRTVATASHQQVNQPIYTHSVGRWRHYEQHLKPLFDALAGT